MSIYQYLQLQPVEPNDDGTDDSPLDEYQHDETIDLQNDIDEQSLDESWNKIVKDLEKDPLNFSDK
jgi:hypothetical protein